MTAMKNHFFITAFFAAAMIVSCQQEQAEQAVDINPFEREFIAEREGSTALSRTIRMSDGRVFWSPADKVSIFCADDANGGDCFVTQNDSPSASAILKGTFSSGASDPGTVWAVYPYSMDNVFDGEYLTLTVPSVQTAVAGTFAADCFPAVARSDSDRLGFKNVCGGIKFTVSRDDIVSVSFKGNRDEVLAGRVKVSLDGSGIPSVQNAVDAAGEVVLEASDAPLTVGAWYYITMLPVDLESGFTVVFTTASGTKWTYVSGRSNSVKRSVFGSVDTLDGQATRQSVSIASIVPVHESVQYHWAEYNMQRLAYDSQVTSYEGYEVSIKDLNRLDECSLERGYSYESLEMEFDVEPSDFAVEDYKWSLESSSAGTIPKVFNPKIREVRKNDSGRLVVSFELENIQTVENNLSIILSYKNKAESGIEWNRSSPVQIIPVKESLFNFSGLAMNSAEEAASSAPRVTIPFTSTAAFGPDSFAVVVNENNEEVSMADLISRYGFTLNARIVSSKVGSCTYYEYHYCTFNQDDKGNWVIRPAFLDSSAGYSRSEVAPDNLLMGPDVAGHSPIILFMLCIDNDTRKIILADYVRVMFADDPEADTGEVLSGFGTKDFILNEMSIYQSEIIHAVIPVDNDIRLMNNGLGMSYSHFRQSFSSDDKTYVKNDNGNFEESDKYGIVTHQKVTPAPFSDSFVLDITPIHEQEYQTEPGKAKVLYKRFINSCGDCVYIGFKVVTKPVSIKFEMHAPGYWFNDIDKSNYNTLYPEVPFPTYWRAGAINNVDIRDYVVSLYTGWKDNKITMDPDLSDFNVEMEWSFADSSEQPVLDGKRLTVSSDGAELSYGSNPIIHLNTTSNYLVYYNNDTAKELLNKWPSTSIKTSEMLYCKVYLRAYMIYEGAGYPFRTLIGEEAMYYRFRRPLEAEIKTDSYLTEGLPGVDFVTIGDLFMLKGLSRQYPLFEKSGDTFQAVPYPKPESFQVDLYGYLDIQSMSFDWPKIQTDVIGRRELFSEVFYSAQVWLAEKDDIYTMIDPSNVDISDPASLGKYVICYANTMPSNRDFNLYIPFTVTYAWGDLTGELVVPVHTNN